MASFLFAWELGGGLGHISVLVPLIRGLLERGHEVQVVARDVSTAYRALGKEAPLLQAPMLGRPLANAIHPPSSYPQVLHNAGFGDESSFASLVAAWCSLYDLVKPDVVVFDHAPTAMVASCSYGFRRVAVGTGFTCPPFMSEFPDWRRSDRGEPDPRVSEAERAVLARVNAFRVSARLQPLTALSALFESTDLTLLTTVAELDHFPGRANPNYLGSWVPQRDGPEPPWPNGKGTRFFAYLKPYRELPFLLSRLASLGCPTVAYVESCPEELRKVKCSSLEISTEPISLQYAVEHCDAAILHAGHISTLQLLLAGKPLFLLPLLLEQRLTANRVAELGAGLCINPHDTQSVARNLRGFMADRLHAEKARAFAQRYAGFRCEDQLEKALAALAAMA